MKNRLPSIWIAVFIALPFVACSLLQESLNDPPQKHLSNSTKLGSHTSDIKFSPDTHLHDIEFSPDGTCLAVASDLGILLYDTQTYDKPDLLRHTLKRHLSEIWSIAFRPDGKILASAGQDGTVRFWAVNSRQQIRTFEIILYPIGNIVFSPDGKTLASSSEDIDGVNNAYLWDADTGKCLRTFSRY